MRKAMVVRASLAGNLDGLVARARFDLAEEELSGWVSRYVQHGVKGLRTTRLQNYRNQEELPSSRSEQDPETAVPDDRRGPGRPPGARNKRTDEVERRYVQRHGD
jgi:hypothetical protein